MFAKKHDADGERDFSVDHALFVKSGRRVLGEKGVIFRLAQERCAPFIEFEKLREIARGVAGVNFRPIERNGILLCEGHDAIRGECAFQVEMEFGLGELAKEGVDFRRGSHRDSLAGGGEGKRKDATESQRHREKELNSRGHPTDSLRSIAT